MQKYGTTEFTDEFISRLKSDLGILQDIRKLWIDVAGDPKLEQFITDLHGHAILRDKKLLVFTESKETGEYLYRNLQREFPGEVMFFCSTGGRYDGEEHTLTLARDLIKDNFDPNKKQHQRDGIRILITTDVLAEGINLHRSNIVINYDLPWNPTRVLQRVGRVNRVGAEHAKVHVFNFFPTAQSDLHLGLEASIKAKIQAFHDTLGEDAKYLTNEEEVTSHNLFGDRLFRSLNDRKNLEGEDEGERSELEYLQQIRDIRDHEPGLFEKIKRLPKKARSCRKMAPGTKPATDAVVTFFRKGKLKKFCLASGQTAQELTFFEAADLFACEPATPRLRLPKEFYPHLERNKQEFDRLTSGETVERASRGSKSNEAYIIKRLKAKDMKHYQGFTDDDDDFLKAVLKAFEDGIIPRNTSKRLKQELEQEMNPLKVLAIFRNNIPFSLLTGGQAVKGGEMHAREVILSEYLCQK
ncbi:MAG: C-terminal helicase domain-containing protein [Syntrophales bacterium]